jgi:hypothetical protein
MVAASSKQGFAGCTSGSRERVSLNPLPLEPIEVVGILAKLTSNLIQKIESNNILVTIFMNMCDLTEYANM